MTNNIMYRGKHLSLHALRVIIFPPQLPPGFTASTQGFAIAGKVVVSRAARAST